MDAQFLKSKLTDKNIIQIINSLGGEIREDNEEYIDEIREGRIVCEGIDVESIKKMILG